MDRRTFSALVTCGLFSIADQAAASDVKIQNVLDALGMAKVMSSKDADTGLRAALSQGTEVAVKKVGKVDGYWGDPAVRIALPSTLAKVQKTLKPLGASGLLDDLHLKMNRAAEVAAPVAKGLFADAIKSMTITDAVAIVKGGNTSGTDYLKKTTSPRLITLFTPPMEQAMESTGAVEYLKRSIKRNGLTAYVKEDPKVYLGKHAVGLALDGLFHYIGVEEVAIRRDPAKRTTQILKSVFG